MTPPSPRLAELAVSLGERFAGAGNVPIRLDDPGVVWFVKQGEVDVFLGEYEDGHAVAPLKHLLRVGADRLVFGMEEGAAEPMAMMARGLPGSELYRVPLEPLLPHGEELADRVDRWIAGITAAVVRDISPHPRPDHLIDLEEHPQEAVGVLSVHRGLVWLKAGGAAFLGTEESGDQESGFMPLTPEGWLRLVRPAPLASSSSRQLSEEKRLFPALAEFHRLALSAEQLNQLLLRADRANMQVDRVTHRRLDEEQSRRRLLDVVDPRRPDAGSDVSPLLGALKAVGAHEGIDFRSPDTRGKGDEEPPLGEILRTSGVRGRRIRLSGNDPWWLGDSGAMLGFLEEDGRPVALLPGGAGRYRMVDPVSGRTERVDANRAADLERDAWFFYRPLPNDIPVGTREMLRFSRWNLTADLGRFVAAGIAASALTLAPAIVVGMLVDRVLPERDVGALVKFTVALVGIAVVGALLHLLQGTALMRIEGRVTVRAVAAAWDRALGLPLAFFRRFTVGELAIRLMAFQAMRDQISGIVAEAFLSVVFLLPTFLLIFLYDAALGWLNLGIGLFSLLVAIVLGLLQIAPNRRIRGAARELAGGLFQYINGIAKLRSTGAEASAFASWAKKYREQKQAEMQTGRLNEHLVSFSAALPMLAAAALFAAALRRGPDGLMVGDFLAVFAASMLFYTVVARFGQSFHAVAAILPEYEQIQPVLEAVPERMPEGNDPVRLDGEVLFDHISFRYSGHGPPLLEDVSIHVRTGEFVAIVGRSGTGKSTLFRLALGLEEAASGGVYYDGRDLNHLNLRAVRRQVGVVVQGATLHPGNVLDNIIGKAGELTIDDARRAARLAALEEDIDAMPMGFFTPVSDSRANFAGGQAQRIQIAAALVRNPRILFLDEATNSLDAESQARVMRSIEKLAVTRVVIAHRLSTIRNANRIYVLEGGRVVQQGSFDELFEVEGTFRNLVRRQMA